jgi:hypothetical protein
MWACPRMMRIAGRDAEVFEQRLGLESVERCCSAHMRQGLIEITTVSHVRRP